MRFDICVMWEVCERLQFLGCNSPAQPFNLSRFTSISLIGKNKMQDLARPALPCQRLGMLSSATVALPGKKSAQSITAPFLHPLGWGKTTCPPPATHLGQSPPSPMARCHQAHRTHSSTTHTTPATRRSPKAAMACPRSLGMARDLCCVPTFPVVILCQLPTTRPRKLPGSSGPLGSGSQCNIMLSQSGKKHTEGGSKEHLPGLVGGSGRDEQGLSCDG